MKVLERLPEMTEHQLAQTEKNAVDRLKGPLAEDAQLVISAIKEERSRRLDVKKHQTAQAAEAIRVRMQGQNLYARVLAAFTEFPPSGWERGMIATLCRMPGATTEELSASLGFSGTYFNWFGHLCHDRQAWLGSAVPAKRSNDKAVWSAIVVDFATRANHDSIAELSTWTLNADAIRAFQDLQLA